MPVFFFVVVEKMLEAFALQNLLSFFFFKKKFGVIGYKVVIYLTS